MSTPTSRRSARTAPQTPSTPTSTLSLSVEPKSEYLRNAIQARRAKDVPATPTPVAPPPPPPPPERRSASAASTADPWLEQAVSEDDMPQALPVRRGRRPSEGGMPRLPTQRELQTETEHLKTIMFDLNLKLELLKKQNNELKDSLDDANKRIDELEPLEDENLDLREDNDALRLKMQNLENDCVELKDENAALNGENAEILKIQEEMVPQMEQLNTALEEAADVIVRSDATITELKEENSRLKDRLATHESGTGYFSPDDADSLKKFPTRIYSIDDSRPSTSHFDSDYYSQPASPHVQPKKPSKEGLKFSERAKNFLELNINGKRSIQELKKRVSDASMKQASRPKSPVPEVPQIPDAYATEQAKVVKRTPGRSRPQVDIRSAPLRSTPATPRTPTGNKEGLRELYRTGKPLDKPTRPSSSSRSPATSTRSEASRTEANPFYPPPRRSSRQAQSSSASNEKLQLHIPETEHAAPKPVSASEMRAGSLNEGLANLNASAHGNDIPLIPSPPSMASDFTVSESVVDHRDKWWKDVRHYPHKSQATALNVLTFQKQLPAVASVSLSSSSGGGSNRPRKASFGGDFLFNGEEDEEEFLARAKGYGYVRKR
ncbi:hypothetical protein CC78DRAFT_568094 [Lojkania enalia]|uniref:Centrosomin N-terminal motif 1 domain-containing protein n=1 Tax=Lojkania enalia TaxID=147567 RepID=A0A9P4KB85_9PLEO|nr:hypothetical protein CC78DRAFT_568094 [Didymosphaeria enalia]